MGYQRSFIDRELRACVPRVLKEQRNHESSIVTIFFRVLVLGQSAAGKNANI